MQDDRIFLKPKFMIIGVQKSGTTALFSYLGKHPQIAPPSAKELDFFSCDGRFRLGLDFYHSHFPRAEEFKSDTITFEASPDYFFKSQSAERISKYNPAMKLIVMLRDPVKRAFSAWNMYVKRFTYDPDWFIRWMKRCDENFDTSLLVRRQLPDFNDFEYAIREELPFAKRDEVIEATLLLHGKYYIQLLRFLEYFQRDKLLVIEIEELRKKPIATLNVILEYLGLSYYNWKEEELLPVFIGEYDRAISKTAQELLSQYYLPFNERLFQLISQRYDWL
jgi:hypothetical protein